MIHGSDPQGEFFGNSPIKVKNVAGKPNDIPILGEGVSDIVQT